MVELTKDQLLERQRYVAAHAPALLAHILSGVAAAGREGRDVDPKACADLAFLSAQALFDRLVLVLD